MRIAPRWTSADLEVLPDDGKRYEGIEMGDTSTCPGSPTGIISVHAARYLRHWRSWSVQTGAGRRISHRVWAVPPDDDDVAPDVVWISHTRRAAALEPDGHYPRRGRTCYQRSCPQVALNERRDREAKLKLYSRRGVLEYWIV